MTLEQIEIIFNRAWRFAFSLKKCLFLFVFLVLCGTFAVLCHTVASISGIWIKLFMYFLPGFMLSGVLLALGVFFARVYYSEMKGLVVTYRKIFISSMKLLVNVTQIALPLVMTYLVIWMIMGLFYLIREIPYVGESIGLILSFAPFILILSSLLLCLGCAFALFFVTPHIAFRNSDDDFIRSLLSSFSSNIFSNILLFLIAFSPCLVMILLLKTSGSIAQIGLIHAYSVLKSGMQWFFMMIPFCAALTPIFLFFFNFSVESYNLIRKQKKLKA
ncbi:MAG: hypothetical protein P0S95_04610 [Rhabdochlamydiaceae bacterium]|nr:hypothetical protein [Candidatus Amphrikana amoebophyrae]